MRHVRRVLERIAVVEDQVGDLALFDAAEAIVDVQEAGRVEGDAAEGAVETEAVDHRHRGFETQDAHLGNIAFIGSADGQRYLVLGKHPRIADAGIDGFQ